jgi:futalosine hydrolase
MILVTAATEFEMQAFLGAIDAIDLSETKRLPSNSWRTLVTGVGPVLTTLSLTRFLCETTETIDGIINFGVAGAYFLPQDSSVCQPQLLDVCVAERDLFGDLGICMGDTIEYFKEGLVENLAFDLHYPLFTRCTEVLQNNGITYHGGTFITVHSVTGKKVRGEWLQKRWDGLCENMEGAAAAQVCKAFAVELFQLRCVSNMVEDRNPLNWRLQEACEKAGLIVKMIVEDTLREK